MKLVHIGLHISTYVLLRSRYNSLNQQQAVRCGLVYMDALIKHGKNTNSNSIPT